MLGNRLLNLAVAVALIIVIAFTVREAAATSVVTPGEEAVRIYVSPLKCDWRIYDMKHPASKFLSCYSCSNIGCLNGFKFSSAFCNIYSSTSRAEPDIHFVPAILPTPSTVISLEETSAGNYRYKVSR